MLPLTLTSRLRDIEARLDALERLVLPSKPPTDPAPSPSLSPEGMAEPLSAKPISTEPIFAEPVSSEPVSEPPPSQPAIPDPQRHREEEITFAVVAPSEPVARAVPPPLPAVATVASHPEGISDPIRYQPKPKPEAVSSSTFERTLGLKWTAWLGALVLVAGAGLGLKFAYDQGWLGGVPPTVRLVLFTLGALGLIAAGEYAYRKINRLASVGFHAAGIALLFLIAYAGHAYYELYGSSTAFVLTGVATLVGAAVSARARLLSIAVLAMVGAHASPLVLGGNAGLTPFLTYLAALHAMALLLAWHGVRSGSSQRWWTLRGLSLAMSALWVLYLSTRIGEMSAALPLFALLTAVMAHLELALASRNQPIHTPETTAYLLLATAFPSVVLFFYSGTPSVTLLAGLGAGAAVSAALAWVAHRRARRSALGQTYRLQGVLLLAAAIPLGLSDDAMLAAGGGVALLAAIFAAYSARLTGRHEEQEGGGEVYFSPLLTLLALASPIWAVVSELLPMLAEPSRTIWAATAIRGIGIALLTYLTAYLHATPGARSWPVAFARGLAGGALGLFILSAFAADPGHTSSYLMTGLAWAIAVLAGLRSAAWSRIEPAKHAYALLGLSMAKFVLFDTLGPRLNETQSPSHSIVLMNLTVLTALLLAGSVLALPKWFARLGQLEPETQDKAAGSISAVPILAAAGLVYLTGLFEIDRAVLTSGSQYPFGVRPEVGRITLGVIWTCVTLVGIAQVGRFRRAAVLPAVAVPVLLLLTLLTGLGGLVMALNSRGLPLVANLPFLSAAAVAATAVYLAWCYRTTRFDQISFLAPVALMLAGGIEVIRFALRYSPGTLPDGLTASLGVTLWCLTVMGATWWAGWRWAQDWRAMTLLPRVILVMLNLLAIKTCLLDLLLPWVLGLYRRGTPVVNLQLFTAAALLGAFILTLRFFDLRRYGLTPQRCWLARHIGFVLAGLLMFLATSIEVARLLATIAPGSRLLITAGYSVWWAIFALGLITLGFRVRMSAVRYTGLVLFALTLLKVVLIDLDSAGPGWRILSFLTLGALLLATSLLYGKLAPLLLKDEPRRLQDEPRRLRDEPPRSNAT